MGAKTHYRKILLAALMASIAVPADAQVTVNTMLPGAGVYLKPQLWNLSVTNTQVRAVDAQVHMQMKDMQTREIVLSAVSARFTVPHGTKILQDGPLQPIQYTYGAAVTDRSPSGQLPVGQYQVCYQLFVSAEGGMDPVSDDCAQLQVEPLSPPLLTMPEDSAAVETATPAFTWVPPAPLSMFGNLNYDFLLSEVYPGQSATDAVQKNLPVQQANSLGQPLFQYPMQSQKLDTGKIYAWQITARDGTRFAAKSEVWTFRLKKDFLSMAIAATPFIRMKSEGGDLTVAPDGILKFSYEHRAPSNNVEISVRDITGAGQASVFTLQVMPGNNFIQEPVGKHLPVQDGHIYLAELTDSNMQHYYLRFRVRMYTKN